MSDNVDDKIKKIFCESLGIPEHEVTDTTSYNSIEAWDSLKHLQLVSALEEAFHIELEMDDIIAMENFMLVNRMIKKYLQKIPETG